MNTTTLHMGGICAFCGKSVATGNDAVLVKKAIIDGRLEYVPTDTPETYTVLDSQPNGRGGFTGVRTEVVRVAGPTCAKNHLS